MAVPDLSKGKGPYVRRSEIAGLVAAALRPQGDSDDKRMSTNECLVKNTTEAKRDVYSVFKLGESILKPDSNESGYKFGLPAHKGEEIDEDDVSGFAVVQQPANVNKMCRARWSGVTLVRLTGEIGKSHATTKEGQYALESADSGPCVILYDPGPADSERIARVRIGGGGSSANIVIFQITERDEDLGCKANAKVLAHLCGGDAPEEITVLDLMGCWFAAELDDMEGVIGVAAKMEVTAAGGEVFDSECVEVDPYNPYEGAKCLWMVLNLCCVESTSDLLNINIPSHE